MACSSSDCKNVLIVDDSPFELIPLEALLSDVCNVTVAQAEGGQEAIDKVKSDQSKSCCSNHFKLVFMDVNMPGVDGL